MFSTNDLLLSLVIIWIAIPIIVWFTYPFMINPIIKKLENIEAHLAFQNEEIRKQKSSISE